MTMMEQKYETIERWLSEYCNGTIKLTEEDKKLEDIQRLASMSMEDLRLLSGIIRMHKIRNEIRPELKWKALHETAVPPIYSNAYAAAFDLSFCGDMEARMADERKNTKLADHYPKAVYASKNDPVPVWVISPHKRYIIHTGIALEIPTGYSGHLMGRSGLSNTLGVTLADKVGLIDSDYRGEITLFLYNESDTTFFLQDGMRVAQLCIIHSPQWRLTQVENLSNPIGGRGSNGYGSTGIMPLGDDK